MSAAPRKHDSLSLTYLVPFLGLCRVFLYCRLRDFCRARFLLGRGMCHFRIPKPNINPFLSDANTSTTAPASSQQSTNANTSGAAPTPSGASASCHIRELEDVNLHLTSPAACAALGLIYLRTGNKWVLEALSIPNTLADIDKIR